MSAGQHAFRLNLEQQKKRAKELLKAARAAEAAALSRIAASGISLESNQQRLALQLADTQRVIARELGFTSWSELKSHIALMDGARAAVQRSQPPDAELATLHVRCGSDIRATLLTAGFRGDFLEVAYPYCHGPVTAGADHLQREAKFLTASAGRLYSLSFAQALARREHEERELAASAARYQRIVLWMEHDCFDQLALVRCLSQYASGGVPAVLELVSINHFPGSVRFIGLGQLPEEALRLLWERRTIVSRTQLDLATQAFDALCSDDPRALAALMRSGAAPLPYLATALHRLLQELPGTSDGASLTERLVLQVLAEGRSSWQRLFEQLIYQRDPLPLTTDLHLLHTVERLAGLSHPVLSIAASANHWRDDQLTLTDTGRAVLSGDRDLLSLQPQSRWVGGVEVTADPSGWRWNEQQRGAVRRR